jgi:hypothetical protein
MASLLPATILRSLRSRAGQLTQLARSLAPKHVAPSISTSVTEVSEGKFQVRIKATSPDARAQEYGSGLHAQKGPKARYPITGKPWLAFMPTNGFQGNAYGAYDPVTRSGVGDKTVMIKHEVMHPGIEAANEGKGYIRPALKEFRVSIRKNGTINKEIKQAILGDLRASFSGVKKNG